MYLIGMSQKWWGFAEIGSDKKKAGCVSRGLCVLKTRPSHLKEHGSGKKWPAGTWGLWLRLGHQGPNRPRLESKEITGVNTLGTIVSVVPTKE